MSGKTWVILAGLAVLFVFVPVASADYNDFIDDKKMEAKLDTCIKKWENYTDRCNGQTPKKQKKCNIKASQNNAKCVQNARKNAVNYGDLPPAAQKEYAKIAVKHDKVEAKCTKAAKKGLYKCAFKYTGKPKKEEACDDAVKNKYADCLEGMFTKYPFKSKKMVKLLKGKTP